MITLDRSPSIFGLSEDGLPAPSPPSRFQRAAPAIATGLFTTLVLATALSLRDPTKPAWTPALVVGGAFTAIGLVRAGLWAV